MLVVSSVVTFFWYRNYSNLSAHVGYVGDNLLLFLDGVTQVIPGVFIDALRSGT